MLLENRTHNSPHPGGVSSECAVGGWVIPAYNVHRPGVSGEQWVRAPSLVQASAHEFFSALFLAVQGDRQPRQSAEMAKSPAEAFKTSAIVHAPPPACSRLPVPLPVVRLPFAKVDAPFRGLRFLLLFSLDRLSRPTAT